jgi:DNA repair protein RadD
LVNCNYRFRFKICNVCGSENDITAKNCEKCKNTKIAKNDN